MTAGRPSTEERPVVAAAEAIRAGVLGLRPSLGQVFDARDRVVDDRAVSHGRPDELEAVLAEDLEELREAVSREKRARSRRLGPRHDGRVGHGLAGAPKSSMPRRGAPHGVLPLFLPPDRRRPTSALLA